MKSLAFAMLGVVLLNGVAFADPDATLIERGKYIVSIAGCTDCHTPKLPDGKPDEANFLHGTVLDFSPKHPVPHWKEKSPNIAGLGHWTDDQAFTLFTQGLDKHGEHSDPPMPAYHMNPDDAKAVIAYLRSLK